MIVCFCLTKYGKNHKIQKSKQIIKKYISKQGENLNMKKLTFLKIVKPVLIAMWIIILFIAYIDIAKKTWYPEDKKSLDFKIYLPENFKEINNLPIYYSGLGKKGLNKQEKKSAWKNTKNWKRPFYIKR